MTSSPALTWSTPSVAPTKPRYFLYCELNQEYTELRSDPESPEFAEQLGDGRTLVSVLKVSEGFKLCADDYYGPNCVCELTISQPFERAMATFAALLAADSLAEQNSLHLPDLL